MKYILLVLVASVTQKRTNAFKFPSKNQHPGAQELFSDGPWDDGDRKYPNAELQLPEAPTFRSINNSHIDVSIKLSTRSLLHCYLAEMIEGMPLRGIWGGFQTQMELKSGKVKIKAKLDSHRNHELVAVAVYLTGDHKYSKSFFYNTTSEYNGAETTGNVTFSTTSLALMTAGGILSISAMAALAVAVKIYCRRDDGVETTEENPYYEDNDYSHSEIKDTNVDYGMADPQGWSGAEIRDLNPEYALV